MRSEPARCEDRKFRRLGDILHEWQVRSTHCFLAMNRGDQHAGEGQTVEVFDEVEHQLRLDPRPAVG